MAGGGLYLTLRQTQSSNEEKKSMPYWYHQACLVVTSIKGRMVFSGISDVAFASVYTEKTRLKKCLIMIIIIIMIKSQEMMIFWRAPKIDFLYETEARKRDARLSNLMLYTGKSS